MLVVLVGISACAQASSSGTTPTTTSNQNQGAIKIGGTVSLTGNFSSDGKALKQGYDLWAATINKQGGLLGRQVQLDIKNDNSDPKQVTTSYQQLITADHVDLLFAPFSGDLAVPAARVANRFGYTFIEGAATEASTFEQHLPNLFSVSLSATNYLTIFDAYILSLPQDLRPKTVAYITSQDSFTQPQIDHARSVLERGGLRTAFYTSFPADTVDYAPLAQKAILSGADVVMLGTIGTSDCVSLMKSFKQQHFNPKALIATAGPDQGDRFTTPLGGFQAAEGIMVPNDGWFPGIKTYQNDQFTKDYVATYGGTVDDISSDTVQAYATGQVLEQAVKKIKSLDNAKLMQKLRTASFNSVQGPVKFAADGENSQASAFLFQWQKGHLLPVYPPSQAQAVVEYPGLNIS